MISGGLMSDVVDTQGFTLPLPHRSISERS